MHPRYLFRFLLLVCTLAATPPANAVLLTGVFSGEATNSGWDPVPDGTPVSGNFWLDTTRFGQYPAEPGRYSGTENGFQFHFLVPSAGLDLSMSIAYVDIYLGDDGTNQSLSVSSGFVHGNYGSFLLTSPSGTLFSDLDLATLRAGPVDPQGSLAHYQPIAWSGGFDVAFDRLALADDASVPEPATLWLALAGLSLLAGQGRRAGWSATVRP